MLVIFRLAESRAISTGLVSYLLRFFRYSLDWFRRKWYSMTGTTISCRLMPPCTKLSPPPFFLMRMFSRGAKAS